MTNAKLLQKLITTPYVPLLGPVHPDLIDEQLLANVFLAGDADELLPFDKDRRWYISKPAIILSDHIYRSVTGMIVPVLSKGLERVKLLCYGEADQDDFNSCVEGVRSLHPMCQITIVSFAPVATPVDNASILFLKRFSEIDSRSGNATVEQISVTEAGSLASLADDAENSGFGFLARQYGERELGPTFVIRDNGLVVAAVGPIDTMPDSAGQLLCLPPYVGVASNYRGRGLGSLVWRAAMSYASVKGATYLLLQSEAGQASEYFYESQGLVGLGAVISRPII